MNGDSFKGDFEFVIDKIKAIHPLAVRRLT